MRRRMRQRAEQEEHGQAIVEFALLFTILTFLVMGVLAFGLILTSMISVTAAAKSAARRATMNATKANEYCGMDNLGEHSNDFLYETVLNSLGGLPPENLNSILIFDGTSGDIDPGAVDVIYADGDEAVGCFDYNDDGVCDCTSCPADCLSGSAACVHDICANTFLNNCRCDPDISIGVEIRYNQEVPVPFLNLITGDVMILPGRAIFHIEG
jgi:hypothetical protein